jgi:preprotein translocase SecE subunit
MGGVFFAHMTKLVRFFQDAYQELKLASWLSRQQMIGSTIVVIVLTLIMAAYVSLIDRILLFLAGILFRIG